MRKRGLLLVLLCLPLFLGFAAKEAQAQTATTFVSNTGQALGASSNHGTDRAQAFTTGSHAAGYTLTSVTFPVAGELDSDHTQVYIRQSGPSSRPSDSLGTLTLTRSSGEVTGTTEGIDLAASTTYFVTIESTDPLGTNTYQRTNSDNEDAGAAAGWSIGDTSFFYSPHNELPNWATALSSQTSWMISIQGTTKSVTATDGVTVSESTLALTELGTSSTIEKTYTVVLDTDPGANVVITATVPGANTADAEIKTGSASFGNTATLTFTHGSGGNWNAVQTVTVRAKNDGDAANETFNITHAATAASGPYNNITISNVAVTTTDAGHGVVVTESTLSVAENDETATYDIVLKSQPGGTVTISVTSGTTASAIVSDATLSFDNTNWQTAQTITVTGKGQGSSTISHSVTTGTTDYPASTSIPSVSVTVTADSSPVVELTSPSAASLREGDTTVDHQGVTIPQWIALRFVAKPDLTVDLDVSYTNTQEGNIADTTDIGTFDAFLSSVFSQATEEIDIVDDAVDEPNGSVTATLNPGSAYRVSPTANSITRVLVDNDPTSVTLSGSGTVVEAGTDSVDVTVTLGRNLIATESVTVPLAISGTGIMDGDYTIRLKPDTSMNTYNEGVTLSTTAPHSAAAPAVVFAGHDTNTVQVATLEVLAQQDTDDEGASEMLTVGFGSGTRAVMSNLDRASGMGTAGTTTSGTGTVTITDDDDPPVNRLTLALASTEDDEGDLSTRDVNVTVSKPAGTADLTYTLCFTGTAMLDVNGTQATGEDYRVVNPSNSVQTGFSGNCVGTDGRWPMTSDSHTWRIRVFGDSDAETDETVIVTLGEDSMISLPANFEIAGSPATYTIEDDDTPPGVTITESGSDTTVMEDGSDSDTYDVVLNTEPTADVTVTVTAGAGAQVNTGGGTPAGTKTLTFSTTTWSAAQTITVTGVDDDIDNADDERVVTIAHEADSTDTNYDITNAGEVEVTVEDDDTAGVSISGSTLTVAENGGTATYTVVLDSEPLSSVTISVVVNDAGVAKVDGPGGTATFNQTETLTFTTGNWSSAQTVRVQGQDDDIDNASDRTVLITHLIASGDTGGKYTGSMSIDNIRVTATDNDTGGVTVTPTARTVGENGDTATYTVVLNSQPASNVTITVNAGDGSVVKVDGPDNATAFTNTETLTFSPSATATLWSTAQTVTIEGQDDSVVNSPARTRTIAHSIASGDGDGGGYTSSTVIAGVDVTLTDDDKHQLTLTLASDKADEGDSMTRDVNVTVAKPAGTTVVSYSLCFSGTATLDVNGTFVAGEDYQVINTDGTSVVTAFGSGANVGCVGSGGTAAFASGVDSHTYRIRVFGDTDGEPDETVIATLKASTATALPSNFEISATGNPATHTIEDDDRVHGLTFTESGTPVGTVVSENGTTKTDSYEIELKTQPTQDVTVTVTAGDGVMVNKSSGTANTTQTLTFTNSNYSTAQTITVTGVNDDIDNTGNARVVMITHATTSTDTNYGIPVAGSVSVTVEDDDTAALVFSPSSGVTVGEGAAGSYTVALATEPTGNVTVTISGQSDTDLTVDTDTGTMGNQDTLTFTATTWSAAQTVSLSAAEDDTDYSNDSVTLAHTAAGGGYAGVTGSVPVTITDDDTAPTHIVSVSVVADAVEGNTGHTDKLITITVTPARSSGFDIDFCLSGTATYGGTSADYEIVDGNGGGQTASFSTQNCYSGGLALTGSGLSSTDQLRIRVTGDSDVEEDETVIVTLKRRSGSTRPTPSDVGISATSGAATYTIENDDTAGVIITESGDGTEVAEGGAGDSYTVRLNAEPTSNVTVTVNAGSGVTVNKSGGNAGSTQTLTFSAAGANIWSTAQTVTVAAAADSADDPGTARSVEITHASSSSDSRFNNITIDSVSVEVTDNDPTTVVLTTPDATAEEGNANATAEITLTLGRGLVDGESLVVPLGFSGGTVGTLFTLACPGSPPTGVSCQTLGTSPQVTFTGPSSGVSATSVTLTFSASEDLNSAGETVTVSIPALSSGNAPILTAAGLAGGASGTRTGNGQITIQDNDTAGISISETNGTTVVGESGTSDTYSIVLNTQPTHDVTVTVTADAGLQVNKVGGSVGSTQTLTFTNSNYGAAQTITVTATDNNTDDGGGGAVGITHSSVSTDVSYNGIMISEVSATVVDNDATAVTLGGGGTVAEDGSNSADVTVTLGRNLVATETVTAPLAVTGTGIAPGDYTIRLKSGANLNSGVTLSTNAPHSAAAPAVVFAGHGTNTVQVATLEVSAVDDTDDEGTSEMLTVGFGSGNRAVTSNLDRADPATTGTAGTTATGTAVVTITDDDTATSPGVTITETGGTSVSEDGSNSDTYDIVLKTQPTHAVTVTVTAGAGAWVNTGGGTPAGTKTLTFSPSGSSNLWSTAQMITVTGVDDDIDNKDDERVVTIAHAATSTDNNYKIPNAGEVSVTVMDNDTAGVTISEVARTVMENGDVESYTVRLETQPLLDVTITVTSGDGNVVKLDGPDSSGVYTDTEDLTFTTTNWGNEQTVKIQGQDDNVINNPSARIVTVSHVIKSGKGDGSKYRPNTPSIGSVAVTVTDDDSPGLMFSRSSVSVNEEGAGSYTVRLTKEPSGNVTVTISGQSGTDLMVDTDSDPGNQDTLTFTTTTWNQAQTVSLRAGDDTDTENDSVTLAHSAAGGGYNGVSGNVNVTISDNDGTTTGNGGPGGGGVPPQVSAPVISVSGDEGGADEGEALAFSVSAGEAVTKDTEVNIRVEQTGEYTETGERTVTIKAGEREAVYEVMTTDDSVDEEDGAVTVTVLSGTGYEVGAVSSVTLEVRDNDTAGIRVSEASVRISDVGGRVSYGVALTSEPGGEVRVKFHSRNSEVAVVSGDLVFTPENWDTEQTVTVTGYEYGSTVIEHEVISEDSNYGSLEVLPEVEVKVEDRKMIDGAGQWLGRFGRTVAERVVEAVSGRFEGRRESRVVEIAGVRPTEPQDIWGEEEQESLSLKEVLLGSSFEVGRKDSAVFWGRASRSSFSGSSGSFRGDGNITMGMGGVDWEGESLLVGMMIIRADGDGEYGGRDVDVYLTGAVPYVGGRITDHLSVWGTAGAGAGEMRVETEDGRKWSTDIGWKMAAGGMRGDILVSKREGLGLAFVSDMLWARSESEDYFSVGVSRIRAGLEGVWTARLGESALFEPRLEAGIRRDGGDAERGFGAELGGGVKLRHTDLGVTLDIEGSGVVSHEDGGFESRGVSASLEWEKEMSRGRGASVALRQEWGEPGSGGIESLFYDGGFEDAEVSSYGSRLSAEAEYGFMRQGMRQAPYVDYGQWGEGRDYALGWRISTISKNLSVDLNATRRESERTEHGVGVRLDVRW